jgi:hypothetical protein
MAMNSMLVMMVIMVLPMVMVMVMMPMVLPMAVVMGMVVVMTVGLPVDVVHLGCQFAGVALSNGDARADGGRCLRLLRGNRDN